MAKRKYKKVTKQSVSSPADNINDSHPKAEVQEETKGDEIDQEVQHQIAAIKTIRHLEVEQLLTLLRLLRSYFNEAQLQTPVLQFFRENLPNVTVVSNGKDGQCEVQWRDRDGNTKVDHINGKSAQASLLHHLSVAYPDCAAAIPNFGGFEFSSRSAKDSILGDDNLQIRDFALEEPSDTQILGLQSSLQTPGATSHRLSVGMTPKTLRLPKNGEMLLSVHGSPLGVYKVDNMEAIHESDEG